MGETTTKKRRKRRTFTDEFRAGAVRLVLDESASQVAKDLDLTESALRIWVDRARANRDERQDRADHGRARGAAAAP
jgi:transposase